MNHIPHLHLAPELDELTRRAAHADQSDIFPFMADCNAARSEANGAAAMAHEILAWLALRDPDLFDELHDLADQALAAHQRQISLFVDAVSARCRELGIDIAPKPTLQ